MSAGCTSVCISGQVFTLTSKCGYSSVVLEDNEGREELSDESTFKECKKI
jgi:hypothetical protein